MPNFDSYFDPDRWAPPTPPECCQDYMDVDETTGVAKCATCGKTIEPCPDIEPVPDMELPDSEDLVAGADMTSPNPSTL